MVKVPTEHPLFSQHRWKTEDPDFDKPDRKGMLLSDQIERFCAPDVNLLIASNYQKKHLRPAAYTLTIGDRYRDEEGNEHVLSEENPSFEMPQNSIVFVSIAEEINLPYYIAARFNLRVEWVYKGILLGTGPQVEPGFRGYLSCPLYNLTDRPLTITRGEEFATIDFERTTNFVSKIPSEIVPKLEIEDKLERFEEDGRSFLLFKQKRLLPLQKYNGKVVSSLTELHREVATWRKIGIAFAVSFLTLTLTLLGLHNNLLRETIGNAKEVASDSKDVIQLKDQVSRLEQEIRELEQKINRNNSK